MMMQTRKKINNLRDLPECVQKCHSEECPCSSESCRMWIEFPEEYNCTYFSINENGPMTLQQISKRLGIHYTAISRILDRSYLKLRKKRDFKEFRQF